MIKTVSRKKVVYVINETGQRLWLSQMGSWVQGQYTFIWDRDFKNARQFNTEKEATQVGMLAVSQLPNLDEFYIAKRVEKSNGTVELQ